MLEMETPMHFWWSQHCVIPKWGGKGVKIVVWDFNDKFLRCSSLYIWCAFFFKMQRYIYVSVGMGRCLPDELLKNSWKSSWASVSCWLSAWITCLICLGIFKNPIAYLLETSPLAFTASVLSLGSGSNTASWTTTLNHRGVFAEQ